LQVINFTYSAIFVDVLGRLKAIQPMEKILVRGQAVENKREFILENIKPNS
jgi:replication factor A1